MVEFKERVLALVADVATRRPTLRVLGRHYHIRYGQTHSFTLTCVSGLTEMGGETTSLTRVRPYPPSAMWSLDLCAYVKEQGGRASPAAFVTKKTKPPTSPGRPPPPSYFYPLVNRTFSERVMCFVLPPCTSIVRCGCYLRLGYAGKP